MPGYCVTRSHREEQERTSLPKPTCQCLAACNRRARRRRKRQCSAWEATRSTHADRRPMLWIELAVAASVSMSTRQMGRPRLLQM